MKRMELKASQSRSLRNRLSKLLFDTTMSDVTFLVGDPPHPFHCHRLIIATGSKAFEAMLFGKMAETSEILIPDITSKAFKNMLRYLYTDEVVFEDDVDALHTAYGAKKYLMEDLLEQCENYLLFETTLDTQTAVLLHEEAAFLDMRRLRRRCLFYVSRNAREVFSSESFLSASPVTLHDVLQMDFLHLDSETEIIKAVWMWGKERCKGKGTELTDENVLSATMDLRKYIRFLSLKSEELESVFENYPFLDESEQLAVLWNIAMPSKVENPKMPLNLCGLSKKRSINNLLEVKMPTEYRCECEMTDFSVKLLEQGVEIKVEGPEIIIVGVTMEVRVIPCYSTPHRRLVVEVSACNEATHFSTHAAFRESASGRWRVFLDDCVTLSEGDVGLFTFRIKAEGVRLMECMQREFSRKIQDSLVTFSFGDGTSDRILFPVEEILCLPNSFNKNF